MKNYSYIGISFIILVFGIYAVPKIVNHFKGNDRLEKIAKAPQFSFTNQDGQTISNKDYEGKVYVLEFFFANCPTICPIMNANLVKLQNEFQMNANFGIVSITIDPENDTPEKLKEHASNVGVTSKRWNMLTGDKEKIYAVAGKFNLHVGENADAPGGFEHSGLFALIDKKGTIRCRKDEYGNPILYYDGTTDSGIKMLKEDIKELLNE